MVPILNYHAWIVTIIFKKLIKQMLNMFMKMYLKQPIIDIDWCQANKGTNQPKHVSAIPTEGPGIWIRIFSFWKTNDPWIWRRRGIQIWHSRENEDGTKLTLFVTTVLLRLKMSQYCICNRGVYQTTTYISIYLKYDQLFLRP